MTERNEERPTRFPLRKFARYGVYQRGANKSKIASPGTRKRDVAEALATTLTKAARHGQVFEVRFWGEATA